MTSRLSTRPTARRRLVAAAGAVLLVGSLAACSGGSSSDEGATTASDVAGGSGELEDKAAAPEVSDDGSGGGSGGSSGEASGGSGSIRTAARVLPSDRDVIYRGSITVRVTDVGQAADRAEALALGADGVVFSEQTSTDPRHPRDGQATLTLRVPPSAFGPTLDAISRLGKELDRRRSAEDVTTQVTDVDSRVRSQQRSVDRVRVLLSRAETIGEVVQVESELARREADLESLQAQLAKLKDVTDLATIEVTLVSPDRVVQHPKDDDDELGFASGLRGGWDAFVGITLVILTVLGALVPFAVVGGLVGVPLLLMWRNRRRTDAVPPAPADA